MYTRRSADRSWKFLEAYVSYKSNGAWKLTNLRLQRKSLKPATIAKMSLTVKAFLYRRSWSEEPVEIRRFSLDQDVSTNYTYLVQKIVQVFPTLTADDIVLAWAGKYSLI